MTAQTGDIGGCLWEEENAILPDARAQIMKIRKKNALISTAGMKGLTTELSAVIMTLIHVIAKIS